MQAMRCQRRRRLRAARLAPGPLLEAGVERYGPAPLACPVEREWSHDRNRPSPHDWDDSYTGPAPPWDIGRPQPAFLRLADAGALTGVLLDAGCGTGEHTILAARRGAEALGIDISPPRDRDRPAQSR